MPPRDPQPAISRRKSKLNLDMPETELAGMLHQYCDLRRRGFSQQAIQTKSGWTKNQQKLLLEEAQRRGRPGAQKSQEQAVTEWLLEMFDAGAELSVIQRTSALSNLQTKKRLETALDAASGPAPTGLIIRNPDGTPARVSWLDPNGTLMHRPFDGAFPADYPAELALRQCTEVARRLVAQPSTDARDRAYTMLLMAEDGLHSFDYEAGRRLQSRMEVGELDDDAKRTVILKLHPNPDVGRLLLQRCGIRPRWLTGNGARFLSRRLREEEFSPAVTRNVLEHLGHDPDTYYNLEPITGYRHLPRRKKSTASKGCRKQGSATKSSKAPWRRWVSRPADTIRPNEAAKSRPESTELAEGRAKPAWATTQ